MRRRPRFGLLAGAVAALLALSGCADSAARKDAAGSSTSTAVSAHRGGDYGANNSSAAFRGALARGVQDVEGDVFFTTDHVGVMHHDDVLDDCGDSARTVTGSTWAQLADLRCAGDAHPATLTDVRHTFRSSPNTTAVFRVEVKHHGEPLPAQQANARLLVRRLNEQGMLGRSIVQDFNWSTTAPAIRSQAASVGQRVRISCLQFRVSRDVIDAASRAGCTDISYNADTWYDGLHTAIHAAGMKVAVYTVDSKAMFTTFRALHADVIITDYPSRAAHW